MTKEKKIPLCLQYFSLKNGFADHFLEFYEDAFKPQKTFFFLKILDILSKHKLDFAHVPACLADSENVIFTKIYCLYQRK